ncbi:BZ3500_MvSof-1268-A1-R1_Chr1-3g01831 [Microbotryum saponariae]|uniref:BZ3500_MvSof-1268-A1-R1_Chr1-3g01831 protein n=1 Tax=Microbotryum saponariae TaxID=289078 RepID=A0A2X0L3L0_9BASI|nr:BZ3500_MvSof-1268-A1-R1_Chr1-3g01831 [Microbotryum saponariae]SCZ94696.1 BZ3501_MvSof-1269-A2-R1_Chr1-3g01433 [Microbotryum saponariae]
MCTSGIASETLLPLDLGSLVDLWVRNVQLSCFSTVPFPYYGLWAWTVVIFSLSPVVSCSFRSARIEMRKWHHGLKIE